MNARLAIALTAATIIGSSIAVTAAQAQPPTQKPTPAANETIIAPAPPNPPPPPTTPTPLFTIGNLPVGIWAPVEPPYDVHANHTVAGNPLWYDANGGNTY